MYRCIDLSLCLRYFQGSKCLQLRFSSGLRLSSTFAWWTSKTKRFFATRSYARLNIGKWFKELTWRMVRICFSPLECVLPLIVELQEMTCFLHFSGIAFWIVDDVSYPALCQYPSFIRRRTTEEKGVWSGLELGVLTSSGSRQECRLWYTPGQHWLFLGLSDLLCRRMLLAASVGSSSNRLHCMTCHNFPVATGADRLS